MTERQLTPTQTLTPTWTTAVETMHTFVPFYQELITAATRQAPPHWFYIVIASANEPKPLTVDQLQAIFPYNDRQALADALQPHVDDDYLQPATDAACGYCATAKGRRLVHAFHDAARRGLATVAPLPAHEMEQLRDLLQEIILNARSPLPAEQSLFHIGRASDPGPESSLAAQINQYLTDLYYFHNDAYIAAWRSTGLDGIAWEALTHVWRDQAHTAAELARELSARLLSTEDYSAALARLSQRGLITLDGDHAQLNEEGRRLCQQVQERTDEIFYAPWHMALKIGEQHELRTLLVRLKLQLQALAEAGKEVARPAV